MSRWLERAGAGPGRACQQGGGMAALYACTKCHQRFPFEALSQGQQLCKVRGDRGGPGRTCEGWGRGGGGYRRGGVSRYRAVVEGVF